MKTSGVKLWCSSLSTSLKTSKDGLSSSSSLRMKEPKYFKYSLLTSSAGLVQLMNSRTSLFQWQILIYAFFIFKIHRLFIVDVFMVVLTLVRSSPSEVGFDRCLYKIPYLSRKQFLINFVIVFYFWGFCLVGFISYMVSRLHLFQIAR